MDNPNISFHVHQVLSALRDISNHILFLPDQYREAISNDLSRLSAGFTEMVSDVDLHTTGLSLADEYLASNKKEDVSPFIRTETVELFDSYIALNTDGEFTYANPTAHTFFGRPEHDLKGKIIWEELPHLREGLFYQTFLDAVSSRKVRHLEMLGANDRWFAINIHPTTRGVIIYWLDITEKKAIEYALLASEERLRAAIETAPISVFTLDKNLRYVWVGSQRDGFFHEPVIGKRDDELLPAQDAAILMEAEQYVLDTGKGLRKEVQFQKNEHPVIYTMAVEPLFGAGKVVIGLTVAVMNVTEQRQLEMERRNFAIRLEMQRRLFEQSEKERLKLARNLHDGPIQRMVGLAFSLQMIKDVLKADRTEGDSDIKQLGDDIQSAVAELRNFCNELRPPVLSRLGLIRALQENMDQ